MPRRSNANSSAMPLIGERTAPWLGGAFLLAALNLGLVLRGYDLADREQLLLLVALCASIAAAGLVSARSNGELTRSRREELARPAADELTSDAATIGSSAYVDGMRRWTGAMVELIDHALSVSDPAMPSFAELSAAALDTRELSELLAAEADRPLGLSDRATLHALGSLWEPGQPRIEQLAAAADPGWHRLWRARTVVERRLRHGAGVPRPFVPPYRS